MSRFRALLAAAVLAAAPLAAQPITLTPDAMRDAAFGALEAGQIEQAAALAEALLRRDPDDPVALVVLAQAQLALGHATAARQLAARLFRISPPGTPRFEAARLTAFAAVEEGRLTLATIWLRRSLLHVPDAAAAEQTLADARAVRSRNPWRTSLSFTLAPSDNVNGGSEGAFNTVEGFPPGVVGTLSPDARALSGWAGTVEARLSYRLRATETSETTLVARVSAREVWLSEHARDFIAAETPFGSDPVTAQDFRSGSVEAGVSYGQALPNGNATYDGFLGERWSGDDRLTPYLRFGADRVIRLDIGNLTLSFDVERRWPDDAALDTRLSLQGTWSLPVRTDDRLDLTFGGSTTLSDDDNTRNVVWTVQAGYSFGQRIGPAELSAAIGYQLADYSDYGIVRLVDPSCFPFCFQVFPVPGGRQDNRLFANLTVALPAYDFAGFTPVVTFGYDGTDSNVSRFSRDGFSVDVAFRSTF